MIPEKEYLQIVVGLSSRSKRIQQLLKERVLMIQDISHLNTQNMDDINKLRADLIQQNKLWE